MNDCTDDDDFKILISNEIQQNTNPISVLRIQARKKR